MSYYSPVLIPGTVSSGIGTRASPGGIGSTNHAGIDIAVPIGTGIVAPVDMDIIFAGQKGGYGNVIYGVDSQGNQHRFAHLNDFSVSPGMTVSGGSLIGASGNTGNSTGPHLHYEIRDSAGNIAKNLANNIVSKGMQAGKDFAEKALMGVLKSNPVTAPFAMGAEFVGFGGGGECGTLDIVCKLKKWFDDTGFIQRAAFFFLGAILIIGGIMFFARGQATNIIPKLASAK